MEWQLQPPRAQEALPTAPYDRWVSPHGVCQAEFHRHDGGFLIRFPGQADFLIVGADREEWPQITGWPTFNIDAATIGNLFHNAICPILGNHRGGLFLHGSAVRVADDGAIAFLGLSRGGKTTLAGSFASAGKPFLTEDVIDLHLRDGLYWLQPKRSKLRLFADSARHLLGDATSFADEDRKQDVEAHGRLPFADAPVPLRQIYVLGTDHNAALAIRRFSLPEALTALMPHAFILDVEDKARLRGHFARMADLSQDTGCFALDYRRQYAELPQVRGAILANFEQEMAGF